MSRSKPKASWEVKLDSAKSQRLRAHRLAKAARKRREAIARAMLTWTEE